MDTPVVLCETYNAIDQYLDIIIKYTVRHCVHVQFQIYDVFFMHLYYLLNEMGFKIVNR